MEKYPINKETLGMIDSSFFVVSLENKTLDKKVRSWSLEMRLSFSSDACLKQDLTLQAREAFHGNIFNRCVAGEAFDDMSNPPSTDVWWVVYQTEFVPFSLLGGSISAV